MSDDRLLFVPERKLEYPVFDSDNHMYERSEAFTKLLPKQYDGIVKYIQESGQPDQAGGHRPDHAGHPQPHLPAGGAPQRPA